MGSEVERFKKSKRLYDDSVYIAKQMRIQKQYGLQENNRTGHRLRKLNALTCGNSNCVMCANPRKFLKELTIQEKRMPADVVETKQQVRDFYEHCLQEYEDA